MPDTLENRLEHVEKLFAHIKQERLPISDNVLKSITHLRASAQGPRGVMFLAMLESVEKKLSNSKLVGSDTIH